MIDLTQEEREALLRTMDEIVSGQYDETAPSDYADFIAWFIEKFLRAVPRLCAAREEAVAELNELREWATGKKGVEDYLALRNEHGQLQSQARALRQIAEEAIAMLNEWDETRPSYQQGTSDGTTAASLATRLAEIGGGE